MGTAAAAWTMAAIAGYGVYSQQQQGERQEDINKKSLKKQETATDTAQTNAEAQLELQRQAIAQADQKKPDTATIRGKRKALASRSRTLLSSGSTPFTPPSGGTTLLGG